jgi:non-specific serine/threonine protein kinase
VTGPPGVGKTHLALALAWRIRGAFADGVHFVDLGHSRSAIVLPTIAAALGVGVGAPRDATISLIAERLHGQQVLLVLDTPSYAPTTATDLAELLAAVPSLQIIVTRRVPLGLRVERQLRLRPLPVPEPAQAADGIATSESPAVQLFALRALAADPAFALTAENADTIVQICNRADGLPIAIVAAAERLRTLTPDAVLAGSGQRSMTLLRDRDVPARHRTVRDLVGWSYDELPTEEQRLLRRVGVFATSFTPEAARAVAVDQGRVDASPDLTVARLLALADKSLLQSESSPDGDLHFRMLGTIREYAVAQLIVTGERDTTEARHQSYFLGRAEELLQRHALAAFEEDLPNLQAALDRAAERGDGEAAIRLAAVLAAFWRAQGPWDVGTTWRPPAIVRNTPIPDDVAWSVPLQTLLGVCAWLDGDLKTAESVLTRSLSAARRNHEWLGVADSMLGLALVAIDAGGYREAGRFLEVAETFYHHLGERRGVGLAIGAMAEVALALGDSAAAARACAEALEIVAASDPIGEILECAAAAAADLGRFETAAELLGAAESHGRSLATIPRQRVRHIEVRAQVKAGLGDMAWHSAYQAGRDTARPRAIQTVGALGATDRAWSNDQALADAPALGERELAVLELAARGLPTKTIARTLALGERTVKLAVATACSKLGARNRAHAIVLATRSGLIAGGSAADAREMHPPPGAVA